MAEETKNTGSWGKPPSNIDRQDRRERRFGILSNLLTLVATGVIIAGGFLMPTLLYPYLDFYLNETVQLARPSENTIAEHVFAEPVPLYPWNLYEADLLKPLSVVDRNLLEERGIPEFLVATLRDYGMQMEEDEDIRRTQIINSFNYLDPESDAEIGCFVLYDEDIDADGRSDLRCAVDLNGNIISLIFVDEQWDSLRIEAPIGVAVAERPDNNGQTMVETPNGPDDSSGEGNDIVEGENPENPDVTGEDDTTTTGENPDENGDPNGSGDPSRDPNGNGSEDPDANGNTNGNGNPTQPINLPVGDDQYLWSFAYAISREARLINQQSLFSAFRQLELNYDYRYGYPFTRLLPIQPAEPENLPASELMMLTPTTFTERDYQLHIYDLPDGERLVLYLNPLTLRCMGFNLLRY
jgi:hypothetical protein